MSRLRLAALLDRLARPRFGGPDEARALGARAAQGGPWVGAFVNAHAVNLCAADPAAAAAFEGADLLLRDGTGVSLLMRLAGRAPGPDMNGTDLIPALCAGRRVALYGGRPGVAQAAARRLEARGAHVVAARHGFHPTSDYLRWLADDAGPGEAELVILGLGMPRQEALALRLRAAATTPVGILCGGAVLDFLAGRTPRAPALMRRAGFEWLFRLGLEPRRLFGRYVIGNPLFLLRAPGLASAMRRGARSGDGSERQRPAIAA